MQVFFVHWYAQTITKEMSPEAEPRECTSIAYTTSQWGGDYRTWLVSGVIISKVAFAATTAELPMPIILGNYKSLSQGKYLGETGVENEIHLYFFLRC